MVTKGCPNFLFIAPRSCVSYMFLNKTEMLFTSKVVRHNMYSRWYAHGYMHACACEDK